MICFLLLGIEIKNLFVVTFLILLEQISLAFRDSMAEALMVILTKTEKRNRIRKIKEEQRKRRKEEQLAKSLEVVEGDPNLESQGNLQDSDEEINELLSGKKGTFSEEGKSNKVDSESVSADLMSGVKLEDFEIENNSQKYVTYIFNVRFIGSFFSSYLAGLLLMKITPHQLLFSCAVLPFFTIIHALFFFSEPQQVLSEAEKKEMQNFSILEVWGTVEKHEWQGYLLFIVVLLTWPNTINGVRYFLIDHLAMTTMDIGMIFTISSVFYIIYMFLMNNLVPNYSLRNYYKFIHLLMVLDIIFRYTQMMPVFYPEGYLIAIGDQTINNLFYDLPGIPLLSIICNICPEGKEATYYAFFVSISNFFCSLANFSGYMYLKILDVNSKDYR